MRKYSLTQFRLLVYVSFLPYGADSTCRRLACSLLGPVVAVTQCVPSVTRTAVNGFLLLLCNVHRLPSAWRHEEDSLPKGFRDVLSVPGIRNRRGALCNELTNRCVSSTHAVIFTARTHNRNNIVITKQHG